MSHPDPVVNYRALWALPGLRLVFTPPLSPVCLRDSRPVAAAHRAGSHRLLRRGRPPPWASTASLASPCPPRPDSWDTHRPRRVLPLLSMLLALTLLALALAAGREISVAPVYSAGAAVAGVVAPPVGTDDAVGLGRLTPDPAARQRAYSLDAVVESGLFAAGPVLAAALAQATSPATALALHRLRAPAGLAGDGDLPLLTGPSGTARSTSRPNQWRPRWSRPMPLLLLPPASSPRPDHHGGSGCWVH